MKHFLSWIYYFTLRLLLGLRYKLEVKGLKNLTPESFNNKKGILFLANHPAEIDPAILLTVLWRRFCPHPVAIDYLFRMSFLRYFLDFVGALSIPSFEGSSNSFKRRQIEKTYERIYALLAARENLLIYPGGGLKEGPEEVIGGASGVHTILQHEPDVNVVLVRTHGLWGSSFSKALTGKTPDLKDAFLHGFKVVIKNFIFFVPRRHVVVEISLAPADFPRQADRRTLNRYLESWYNQNGPEPLALVSYSRFREEYPVIKERPKEEEFALEKIPDEIKEKVVEEVAALARMPNEAITIEKHLALDLGLDSLDLAQLVVALKEDFGVSGIQSSDLTTVGSLLAFATGIKKGKIEEEEEKKGGVFKDEKGRPQLLYPVGKTLPEVFFRACHRMGGLAACYDEATKLSSYRKLKFAVLLFAEEIKKMEGEHIGILLPASAAVNVLILATMCAHKIPVMINWTLGSRNLGSIIEQAQIKTTISSWSFLNRLDNVELGGFDDQIALLEEISRSLSLGAKFKTIWRTFFSISFLLKRLSLKYVKEDETAVILFTSGTESFPKGVPLSHRNLIYNQRASFAAANLKNDDIFLGVLPPFHSFGFSVTGLLPLFVGVRVGYFPNPTDGRRIAKIIENWGITILCLAPTFLKNLLRVATEKQMKTLRLIVVGAEKMPAEMTAKIKSLNPSGTILEGYGITECSPILTLNREEGPHKGVGLPIPGVEIQIVNAETLKPVKKGEEGLILARGVNIFKGYLDPKLPSPFVEIEGAPWYDTGDIGLVDPQGYLTILGRKKRFVKIGGEMISLTAVEEALSEGLEKQGVKLGPDTPSLAVVYREAEGEKSELHLFTTLDMNMDTANRFLKEQGMSNLIRIREVHKIPYIPLLGTGKIDYRKLTQKLQSEP